MPDAEDAAKRKALIERVSRVYETERDRYIKNEFETSRDFDKWGLTVAGGALGVSFTFLKDVVPLASASGVWLVGTGWLLLVGAVGCLLSAVKFGTFAHRRYRECLDKAAEMGLDAETFKKASEAQAKCRSAEYSSGLRWAGLVLILLGIALLFIFVFVNIERSPNAQGQNATAAGPGTATATTTANSATATATGPGGTARAEVGAPGGSNR